MKKILMIYKRDGDKVFDDYIDEYKNYDKSKLKLSIKLDGTSCLIKDGKLYKRYDNKKNKEPEKDGIFCYKNDKHNIYGIPVEKEDKGHGEGFDNFDLSSHIVDDTYELVGPKINGNKHQRLHHELVRHRALIINDKFEPFGTKYDGIYTMNEVDLQYPTINIEGFVLGDIEKMEPMFKIRKRDLGVEF